MLSTHTHLAAEMVGTTLPISNSPTVVWTQDPGRLGTFGATDVPQLSWMATTTGIDQRTQGSPQDWNHSAVGTGVPGRSVVKNQPANAGDAGLIPGSGRSPLRRKRLLTSVFLPGEFYGRKSLAGYSAWGHKESDVTNILYVWWGNAYKEPSK